MKALENDTGERLTREQRARALKAFGDKQYRDMRVGQAIVFSIAGLNALFLVLSAVTHYNLFTLVVRLSLIIALLFGVPWVKYYFAIIMALGALIDLSVLFSAQTAPPGYVIAALIIGVALNIAGSILLFANKCVHEFLYAQKNG